MNKIKVTVEGGLGTGGATIMYNIRKHLDYLGVSYELGKNLSKEPAYILKERERNNYKNLDLLTKKANLLLEYEQAPRVEKDNQTVFAVRVGKANFLGHKGGIYPKDMAHRIMFFNDTDEALIAIEVFKSKDEDNPWTKEDFNVEPIKISI